jgi:hypothetical protein
MKKTFYEKKGRRYVPVYEYDSELLDSYQSGAHLVIVKAGHTMKRYNIKPELAPMIAAAQIAREKITDALVQASEMRSTKTPLTEQQLEAWKNLAAAFGDSLCTLETNSVRNIVETGINVMVEEAQRLLTNPSARAAYEQFLLISALTENSSDS